MNELYDEAKEGTSGVEISAQRKQSRQYIEQYLEQFS